MTIPAPTWLRARQCNVNLRNMFASGGRAASGREQRVFGDAGFVEVTYSGIRIANREEARGYRAMLARLRAGEDILLPVCDLYAPVGARSTNATITLGANASLRATQLSLTASGVDIRDGHHLTIGDRLHVITQIVSGPAEPPLINPIATDANFLDEPWTDAVEASAGYVVRILPPTRAALAAGETARFRDLILRCQLKDSADGDLDLDLGRFGAPSLTFIESL